MRFISFQKFLVPIEYIGTLAFNLTATVFVLFEIPRVPERNKRCISTCNALWSEEYKSTVSCQIVNGDVVAKPYNSSVRAFVLVILDVRTTKKEAHHSVREQTFTRAHHRLGRVLHIRRVVVRQRIVKCIFPKKITTPNFGRFFRFGF